MLLELNQPAVAKEGLGTACEAIVALFAHLATAEATVASVDPTFWPHSPLGGNELGAVLALTLEQRARLHEAVRADLCFADELDNANFSFRFPELDAETRAAGAPLLVSMYERVFTSKKKGFLFGEERANRSTWGLDFHAVNQEVEVCPACAIGVLERPVGTKIMGAVDHYLPKAAYPPLAVHGLNLVLVCTHCNSILKGSKDPLGKQGERLSLADIWFPYRRPGTREISLTFEPDQPAKEQVAFTGAADAERRAQRFDAIFSLRERWAPLIGMLHERLLLELFRRQGPSPQPVDAAAIRASLATLETDEKARHTTDSRAFLKSHYYAWLGSNEAAIEALVPQVNRLIAAAGPDSP